ncbi:MAG: 23S rRNA (uracil(1939)-C(5))-methyltransferase RlmD [Pseudomonadota bacterium]
MGRKASRFPREPQESSIRALTHDGRGIAETDGKTVFVAGALPGERVLWQRARRKRNYDEATALEILEPSEDRVDPECDVFGQCGGCVMQHLSNDAQLQAKHQVLVDNLERTGQVTPSRWLVPLSTGNWHYRRRARLGVKYVDGKGRVLVGFRERYKPYITDMKRCPVLVASVDALITPLAEMIATLSIARRLPQIELAVGDSEHDGAPVVYLIFRVLDTPSDEDTETLRTFARAHNIWCLLQPGGPDSIHPLEDPARGTPPPLLYRLAAHDVTLWFEPSDFIQVNAAMNEHMVNLALEYLALKPQHRVLDLFSGIGNFTLPIARHVDHVHGVEGLVGLTERARSNASKNQIDNASFATGDLEDEATWQALLSQRWDRILLDPARAGAALFASKAAQLGAPRIVYISCHPGTLARDAGLLVTTQGYTLTAAGVMNMFPHTAHVESIAVFDQTQVAA